MYRVVSTEYRFSRKLLLGGVLAAGVAAILTIGKPVWSQSTESGSINFTATSVTTCTISTNDQDFGNYTGAAATIEGSPAGTGVVIASLNCAVGFVDAVFCLDEGLYFDSLRRMRNVSTPTSTTLQDNIIYEVYVPGTSFTTRIGEAADPSDTTGLDCAGATHPGKELFKDVATGYEPTWDIYAEMKTFGGGQNPGSYSDTLTATFIFQ